MNVPLLLDGIAPFQRQRLHMCYLCLLRFLPHYIHVLGGICGAEMAVSIFNVAPCVWRNLFYLWHTTISAVTIYTPLNALFDPVTAGCLTRTWLVKVLPMSKNTTRVSPQRRRFNGPDNLVQLYEINFHETNFRDWPIFNIRHGTNFIEFVQNREN